MAAPDTGNGLLDPFTRLHAVLVDHLAGTVRPEAVGFLSGYSEAVGYTIATLRDDGATAVLLIAAVIGEPFARIIDTSKGLDTLPLGTLLIDTRRNVFRKVGHLHWRGVEGRQHTDIGIAWPAVALRFPDSQVADDLVT